METKERRVPGKTRKPSSDGTRTANGKTAGKPRSPGKKTEGRKPAPERKKAQPGRRPRRTAEKKPSPDVVYVQPAPFNKGKFILCIVIAVAVALAVILGIGIWAEFHRHKLENLTDQQLKDRKEKSRKWSLFGRKKKVPKHTFFGDDE